MFTSTDEVLAYIKEEGVEFVDIRFTDLPGMQHHFNVPASAVDEDFPTMEFKWPNGEIPQSMPQGNAAPAAPAAQPEPSETADEPDRTPEPARTSPSVPGTAP